MDEPKPETSDDAGGAPDERADSPWRLVDDLLCLGCEYNLWGMTGPIVICPECGRKNDLTDPTPWAPPAIRSKLRFGLLGTIVASFLGAPSAVLLVVTLFAGPDGDGWLTAPFAAVMTIVWLVCCRAWIQRYGNRIHGAVVLVGAHLSVWALLVGLAGVTFALRYRLASPGAIAGLLAGGGIGAYWVVKVVDREAARLARRRDDWRLPLGGGDER